MADAHEPASWVKKWPASAPSDLVQEYRQLHEQECMPLKTLLKTFKSKDDASVLRQGKYKGYTVKDAIDEINRKLANISVQKTGLEQKIRNAMAEKGVERISAAENHRAKAEAKLHEALNELSAQKTDLTESKDAMTYLLSG